MDPTANLEEQTQIALRIDAGNYTREDAERLAELMLALHDWIVDGGFLPLQWGGNKCLRNGCSRLAVRDSRCEAHTPEE